MKYMHNYSLWKYLYYENNLKNKHKYEKISLPVNLMPCFIQNNSRTENNIQPSRCITMCQRIIPLTFNVAHLHIPTWLHNIVYRICFTRETLIHDDGRRRSISRCSIQLFYIIFLWLYFALFLKEKMSILFH